MQQAVKTVGGEHRLTLGEILDGLIEDKLVSAEAAEQLKKERRYYRGTMHPLAIVADQKWKKGNALLTLDALTEWLAKRVGLEYLHIDPLKIDFAAVIRTTRISCAWLTGAGSTPSSSAGATSTASRAASRASCASASTVCCTRCTRSPARSSRR